MCLILQQKSILLDSFTLQTLGLVALTLSFLFFSDTYKEKRNLFVCHGQPAATFASRFDQATESDERSRGPLPFSFSWSLNSFRFPSRSDSPLKISAVALMKEVQFLPPPGSAGSCGPAEFPCRVCVRVCVVSKGIEMSQLGQQRSVSSREDD